MELEKQLNEQMTMHKAQLEERKVAVDERKAAVDEGRLMLDAEKANNEFTVSAQDLISKHEDATTEFGLKAVELKHKMQMGKAEIAIQTKNMGAKGKQIESEAEEEAEGGMPDDESNEIHTGD